jgi:hypothetical protein
VEIEDFKRGRQERDATLDALEAILYDPKVMAAVSNIQPFVESPSLASAKGEEPVLM